MATRVMFCSHTLFLMKLQPEYLLRNNLFLFVVILCARARAKDYQLNE